MVMQFGDNEEFKDHDPDDAMMCVRTNYGEYASDAWALPGSNMPSPGDPAVISCHLLLRFLDDGLNMMMSLQYVTVGLMIKLDDMKYKFPFDDLYEKLRWHANCYWEWQEADTSKFLESQNAIVDSAKALCYFFLEFSRQHTIRAGIFPTKVPPTGRKFFLGGNWKCNGTTAAITQLVTALNGASFPAALEVDIVVFPPLLYLDHVLASLTPRVDVGAQNCWVGKMGAMTGEVSAEQLADVGVKWVIAGHAERRHILMETNAMVAGKAAFALSQGLSVVIAVGETDDERDLDLTHDVLVEQLQPLVSKIADWSRVVLAYEPVWAIGTGRACSPDEAQAAHALIRDWMRRNISEEVGNGVRIIYGASVSSATCEGLAKMADVDGFFVGGAAWNADEFEAIAKSVKVKKNIDIAVEQMEATGEAPDSKWHPFLEALVKLRALALKRFSTTLFEQECIDGYTANVFAKLENATALNKEATKQLAADRVQREADHKAYLDAELAIVRDEEASNLQHELLEKRTDEDFKALQDQEFSIFDAEYSSLLKENEELAEKLLDMQNNSRTWELQQRGKNCQSAEEVADLVWVCEHHTKAKAEELAKLRVENDTVGAHLREMLMYYVRKDHEELRKEEERLQAAYAICEKKRKRWQPHYAAIRIQRYWKRYLKKKNGGAEPPKKGKGKDGEKGGKKGKKGKKQ